MCTCENHSEPPIDPQLLEDLLKKAKPVGPQDQKLIDDTLQVLNDKHHDHQERTAATRTRS